MLFKRHPKNHVKTKFLFYIKEQRKYKYESNLNYVYSELLLLLCIKTYLTQITTLK